MSAVNVQISPAAELPQHTATPSPPDAGNMLLYAKGGSIYAQTPAGVETVLGGSGGSSSSRAFFLS